MKLRNAFVLALIGTALVAPILFREQFSLAATNANDNLAATTAASSMAKTSSTVGCNVSCQNGMMRLVDAYSDYDDRKRGRDARNTGVNEKGLSVMAMVDARVNNRPAFIFNMPA